jgi:hypothetical protein
LANDSAIEGTGGSPTALDSLQKFRVLSGEHPSVRMVRERVNVVVGAEYYDVTANFEFHNSGNARTVLMGFPEGASGDFDANSAKTASTFKSFATWVDGHSLAARRVLAGDPNTDYALTAYWVKSVSFQRNQTRRVRVAYRAPLGGNTMSEEFIVYDFTGGNWKGEVAESVLSIRFTQPGHYLVPNYPHSTTYAHCKRNSDTYSFLWKNWQAQESFIFHFVRTLPHSLTLASDLNDLNTPSSLWPNATEFTLRPSSGNFDVWMAPIRFAPQGVLRDGLLFVPFRRFSEDVRRKWEERHNTTATGQAGLYVQQGLFVAPNYGGDGILAFSTLSREATIGSATITLAATPFVTNGTLYIPLADVVKALHGTIRVNSKTRRFFYDVPV